ncbi:L-serine ammonia-lyase [Orrella dioscoreae]|uniref:L-serine dehydratase n=1 Tax=Orrella dioscoreae TaxID=1851544 RepID=A0A1C3K0J0_9BURK|nr:L-serine ammonia-lyase [Orrella dioscoreae]SBT25026.1 L-serine dehydratase [Orrella dioscoreae]SOE47427.1 L-serine dehydratase [Orrella dioscoreae]
MTISTLDLFKVGIGPSSSHTTGPMRAGLAFARDLRTLGLSARVAHLDIRLYGSLAATGIGHATDLAVVGGLLGHDPATVDPDQFEAYVAAVRLDGVLRLDDAVEVPFDWRRDLRMVPVALARHPNALRLTARDGDGQVLHRNTYFSIGGGFIIDANREREAGDHPAADTPVPYPYTSAAELLALCRRHDLSMAEIVLANEAALRPESDTRTALATVWRAMQACVTRGLHREGILPGGLNTPRRAAALRRRLEDAARQQSDVVSRTLSEMDWVNLYALAVNEENASGGRVVTAPTNGAAGIIPAVLHFYARNQPGMQQADVDTFLFTASAIGGLCKRNASISGAEVGCQGEVGVACAMAAAGLAALLGGTPEQIENAAEIGLEHNLGLTCDPVGGLVQVPCIERNAIASMKAINAARMALHGDGRHLVSLDQAIRTLRETGRDMLSKYKETSLGGLAVSVVEC